jgi:hypothetical protein
MTDRVWFKSRGTVPFPAVLTSVKVPFDKPGARAGSGDSTIVDDLKALLKAELSPVLDAYPKSALNFYLYNRAADDYLPLPVHEGYKYNPAPSSISASGGETHDQPIFFDLTWDK